MIFIVGISPKTRKLDQNPRRCPACGLHQAYLMRVDHYLYLFFIPVLRIKKGEPIITCERCANKVWEAGSVSAQNSATCRHCGKSMDRNFNYCPFCGKKR
jgi:hypothetical protein